MDPVRFNQLLDNYTALTAEEATGLIALVRVYPYCQALTTLTARAGWDHQSDKKQLYLYQAALRSPDRSVLKEIITAPRKTLKSEIDSGKPEISPITNEKIAVPAAVVAPERDSRSAEQVRKELLSDLHELSRLMKRFETQAERVDMLSHKAVSPAAKQKGSRDGTSTRIEKPDKPTPSSLMPPESAKKTGLGTDERSAQKPVSGIAELPEEDGTKEKSKKEKDKKGKKHKGGAIDPLLREIKEKKKKIRPAGKKRKAQRELIDRFIKEQPTIPKPTYTNTPGVDLSEASTAFSNQIISETLVEILIKQGKREKAIEVLKKLIWKIPQKKATFAAQIEELKRS